MVLSWLNWWAWKLIALACASIVAITLSSCGGDAVTENVAGEPGLLTGTDTLHSFEFPKPSELKQISVADLDLFQHGRQFVPEFPNQHVTIDTDFAVFSPNWQPETATFEDLAFAIYSFNLEDFDREEIISAWWREDSTDIQTWVGLADFAADAWDWNAPGADSGISRNMLDESSVVFETDRHIDPVTSRLFLLLVYTGSGERLVRDMLVGGVRPISAHGIFPNAGLPNQMSTFSAFIGGSEPLELDWDFGGGATPNTSSDKNPVVELGEPGDYVISLVVTNPFDARLFLFNLEILEVNSDWAHTWGGVEGDRVFSICLDDENSAYVAGFTDSFDVQRRDACFLKYNEIGNLLWKRTWGGDFLDEAYGICLTPDNDLIAVGRTKSFGVTMQDVFIVRFDSDGNLVWQKTWHGVEDDEAWGVATDDLGNIYVTGNTISFGIGAQDVFLLKLDSDGELLWQRTWGHLDNDHAYSICVGSDGNLYLAGRTQNFTAGAYDSFILKYDTDGNLIWQRTWGTAESDWTWGISCDSSGNQYVTGGTTGFSAGEDDVYLLKYDTSGNLLWARSWDNGNEDIGYGVVCDAADNPYVGGTVNQQGIRQVLLLKFSPSGALLGSDVWEHTIYSHTYLGNVLDIDSENAVRLAGSTEYVVGGVWLTQTGTVSSPVGVTGTPSGVSLNGLGISESVLGVVTEPIGILDTGSGFNDMLVLKHTIE